MSDRQRKVAPPRASPPSSALWAQVRKNVKYVGCFADYPRGVLAAQKDKWFAGVGTSDIAPPDVTRGDPPGPSGGPSPVPPADGVYRFYLDGPMRQIPSVSAMPTSVDGGGAERLPLYDALGRCYQRAQQYGRKYFGLQNGGALCVATDRLESMGPPLPQNECRRACATVCLPGMQPCGSECVLAGSKAARDCEHKHHRACAFDETEKGEKGGGWFTNAVYEVLNPDFESAEARRAADLLVRSPPVSGPPPPPDPEEGMAYDAPRLEDNACEEAADGFFPLTKTQIYAQRVMKPGNGAKGMLSYVSAGAGKTCLGVNVAAGFMSDGWRVVWVTRDSIKDVPYESMYGKICVERLRHIVDDDSQFFEQPKGTFHRTRQEKIDYIRRGQHMPEHEVRTYLKKKYGFEFQSHRIVPYDDMVKAVFCACRGRACAGPAQTLFDQQIAGDPQRRDIGYRTLFIIDEAHNLITDNLPEKDRQLLDADAEPGGVSMAGRLYRTRRDVYGTTAMPDADGDGSSAVDGQWAGSAPVQGRDLLAAMLYRSYELSGEDSARVLLLTATPMSSSPLDMVYLLNLLEPVPERRLPLRMGAYYDPVSLAMREEQRVRLSEMINQHVSYLDMTRDTSRMAFKMFRSVVRVRLHRFHLRQMMDALKRAHEAGAKSDQLVAMYRSLSISPKVSGKVYEPAVLRRYEQGVRMLKTGEWSTEAETARQRKAYEEGVRQLMASAELPSWISAASLRKYEKYRAMYEKWVGGGMTGVREEVMPDFPRSVAPRPVVSSAKPAARAPRRMRKTVEVPSPGAVSGGPDKGVVDFLIGQEGSLRRMVAPADIRAIVDENGDPMLPEEMGDMGYGGPVSQVRPVRQPQGDYSQLMSEVSRNRQNIRARKMMESYAPVASASSRASGPLPDGLAEYLDADGRLLNPAEWALRRSGGVKRTENQWKKLTEEQRELLIRDPASGVVRVRAWEEYVDVRVPDMFLDGPENGPKVDMVMWYRSFSPRVVRQIMPFYAPKVFACVRNILRLEQSARQQYGHGFKHSVFTFSTAGFSRDHYETAYYGSRLVMSLLASFDVLFNVNVDVRDHENEDGLASVARGGRGDARKSDRSGVEVEDWGPDVQDGLLKEFPKAYAGEPYGVVALSSRKITLPNGQEQDNNPTANGRVKNMFNRRQNVHGDEVRVIVLDGAFTEGVSLYDVRHAHFLDPGLSKSQLEQAVSRSVRMCQSRNLPVEPGVGNVVEMHFYEDVDEEDRSVYTRVLERFVPQEEQMRLNLMDRFADMSRMHAMDSHLTRALHEFGVRMQGRVLGQPVRASGPGGETILRVSVSGDLETVLVPLDHVEVVWKHGGKPPVLPSPDAAVRKRTGVSVPPPEGAMVVFRLPYGVDMAQRMLNIGNYSAMRSSMVPMNGGQQKLTGKYGEPLKTPKLAMSRALADSAHQGVVRLPDTPLFASNINGVLLAMVSLRRQFQPVSYVRLVMPSVADVPGDLSPVPEMFGAVWDGERLRVSDSLWRMFIGDGPRERMMPGDGPRVSLMPVFMIEGSAGVGGLSRADGLLQGGLRAHVLAFCRTWRAVERFDTAGHPTLRRGRFAALDAALERRLRDTSPELQLMASMDVCPSVGLRRTLRAAEADVAEQKDMSPREVEVFCDSFALFYMYMRITQMAHLACAPTVTVPVTPVVFRRALLAEMARGSGRGQDAVSTVLRMWEGMRALRQLVSGEVTSLSPGHPGVPSVRSRKLVRPQSRSTLWHRLRDHASDSYQASTPISSEWLAWAADRRWCVGPVSVAPIVQ